MPTSVADDFADQFVFHEVNLARLQAGQQQDILKALRSLEAELTAQIQQAGADGASFSKTRARALFHEVQTVIKSHYTGIYDLHRDQLKDMGTYEAQKVQSIVNQRIKVPIMSVGVPESVIHSMGTIAYNGSEKGFTIQATNPAGGAVSHTMAVHWSVGAEL